MANEVSKKRTRDTRDGYVRRHDRNKFRKTTNPTSKRKDLGNGMKGVLFSCTPGHENHAFREAVIMLGKFCGENETKPPPRSAAVQGKASEENGDAENIPKEKGKKPESGGNGSADANLGTVDIAKELEEELKDVRDPKKKLFTREDFGVRGCLFMELNRSDIDREKLVEDALRQARATGSPHSRHCIRLLPVHSTCYAKPEEAAKAALEVVKEHFPVADGAEKAPSYAIAFRHRLNTSAHREAFITAIAKAIHDYEPRYKVELTKPDVTLLVEVLKTSCCIGTFRHYYELAKMNLREAACPSKPKETKTLDEKTISAPEKEKGGETEAKPETEKADEPNPDVENTEEKPEAVEPEPEKPEESKAPEPGAEAPQTDPSDTCQEGAKKDCVTEAAS